MSYRPPTLSNQAKTIEPWTIGAPRFFCTKNGHISVLYFLKRCISLVLSCATAFLVLTGLPRQTHAGDLTTIASFNGTDGANPYAPVTGDAQGNLYGTTILRGAYNQGSVWEIANGSNSITTLDSFSSPYVPPNPYGGVTMDAQGNLYGTTSAGGGANEYGSVWEIAKGSNTITTIATFNSNNGQVPESGLIIDSKGNLYGTTSGGGGGGADTGGTVFEIVKGSNTITTLASFTGVNGSRPYSSLTMDAQGNLYGTTYYGGTSNNGTVFEIVKGSNTITTLASFTYANGANPIGGVSVDSHGNLFGTTTEGGNADAPSGTVWEIVKGSNTITTLAEFIGSNGQSPTSDVTIDANGNLYGTTSGAGPDQYGTLWEIASGSNTLDTLVSFGGANGANPYAGLTMDADGQFYGTTVYRGLNSQGTVFSYQTTVPEPSSFALTIIASGPVGGTMFLKRLYYLQERRRSGD
jgi:uncharacterized repeat protein (TIGR03803 family)